MPDATRRRQVLQTIGGAGLVGLAGCLGGESGQQPSGGSGENQADQSTPTRTTRPSPQETITVHLPPWEGWNLITNYLETEGIFEEKFANVGANVEFQRTWEGPPLYAGGQVDIASLAAIEAAQLAARRELPSVYVGNILSAYIGVFTYRGSGYEVSETGSPKASLDRLSDTQEPFAIIGWDSGTTQIDRIVLNEVYDIQFDEDDSDLNASSVDIFAVAGLLANEQVAAGQTSPILGGMDKFVNYEVYDPIFLSQNEMIANGYGRGSVNLNGTVVREEVMEDHEDVVRAYIEAFNEGSNWLHDNVDTLLDMPGTMDLFDVPQTRDQAQLWLDYAVKTDMSNWPLPDTFELEVPPLPRDIKLTNEWVEDNRSFLEIVVPTGIVPADWEDYLRYEVI